MDLLDRIMSTMTGARPSGTETRVSILFHYTFVRYLVAVVTVLSMFAIRIWLVPFTGTGAPFVLFFAAVLVTSLFAGVGPGIFAVLLSMPLAAYTFVVEAGYSVSQASFQSLLFSVDGAVAVYLTSLMRQRQLRGANEEMMKSMA